MNRIRTAVRRAVEALVIIGIAVSPLAIHRLAADNVGPAGTPPAYGTPADLLAVAKSGEAR